MTHRFPSWQHSPKKFSYRPIKGYLWWHYFWWGNVGNRLGSIIGKTGKIWSTPWTVVRGKGYKFSTCSLMLSGKVSIVSRQQMYITLPFVKIKDARTYINNIHFTRTPTNETHFIACGGDGELRNRNGREYRFLNN